MKYTGLIAALLFPLTSHAFSLAWPLDCDLGKTCFIQNFVEHGTAEKPADFTCGSATFRGLTGTDIRIKSLAAMRHGVIIRAATQGTVIGTRNTVEDISIRDGGEETVKNRKCGNGVNIQNAEGYSTQYCHLMKGSVRVHTGQQVNVGDALGLVGLSGETEFPHLHINIMKDGGHIDPFTGTSSSAMCDAQPTTPLRQLWASPIAYQPTALLNDGLSTSTPDKKSMLDTPIALATLPTSTPTLFYWSVVMNVRTGDTLIYSLIAPDGSALAEHSTPMVKPMAQYFSFIGKKNVSGNFPAGTYHARVQLLRDGAAVVDATRAFAIQ